MNKGLLRIRGPTYPLKLPCVIKLHVLARSLFYRYAPPFPQEHQQHFREYPNFCWKTGSIAASISLAKERGLESEGQYLKGTEKTSEGCSRLNVRQSEIPKITKLKAYSIHRYLVGIDKRFETVFWNSQEISAFHKK